jgi:hypothetical protein
MENARTSQALRATVAHAREVGLRAAGGVVLQSANRLAVRLVPCDVVARVAPGAQRNRQVAAFELEMARRLEEAGCPIAVLEPRVEPVVHGRDGFVITYWAYYEPFPPDETTAIEYGRALERLHVGMRAIDAPAPHFTERVDEAQSIARSVAQPRDHRRRPGFADVLVADAAPSCPRSCCGRATAPR